jgi:hypothetical protein
MQSLWKLHGFLFFGWVIPATILLVILLDLYLPFLRSLMRTWQALFIFSGGIYIGGALGIEYISGYIADYHPDAVLVRGALATLEDFMELSGIGLFSYSLLSYLRYLSPRNELRFTPAIRLEAALLRTLSGKGRRSPPYAYGEDREPV